MSENPRPKHLVDAALVGELLGRDYLIEERVGRGGMAWVYRATHRLLGGASAVKILYSHYVSNPNVKERFIREARSQYSLNHPNIVRVLDFIEEGGLVGFVLEWCNGGELIDWLVDDEKGISLGQLKTLFFPVLDAMDYAHRERIVHRDLKPQNILVQVRGKEVVPKITDFGIAKFDQKQGLTNPGTMVGTLHYMAPEQLKGRKDTDQRSDIYSLGVILYQLLRKRLPFEGESMSMIMQVLEQPPPPIQEPNVSPALNDVVMRCLEKEPERRFATCDELKHALDAAIEEPPAPVNPPSWWALEVEHTLSSVAEQVLKDPSGTDFDAVTSELQVPGASYGALPSAQALPRVPPPPANGATEVSGASLPQAPAGAPLDISIGSEEPTLRDSKDSLARPVPSFSPKLTKDFERPKKAPAKGGPVSGGPAKGGPAKGGSAKSRGGKGKTTRSRPKASKWGRLALGFVFLLSGVAVGSYAVTQDGSFLFWRGAPAADAGQPGVRAQADAASPSMPDPTTLGSPVAPSSPERPQPRVASDGGPGPQLRRQLPPDATPKTRTPPPSKPGGSQKACLDGDGAACFAQAQAQQSRKQLSQARKSLKRACRAAHKQGCLKLGRFYHRGLGGDRDDLKARVVLQQACQLGLPRGCVSWASLLRAGLGGPRNLKRALALFQKGCQRKLPKACYDVGRMLQNGRGQPVDLKRAQGFFLRACELKHGRSCLMAGVSFEKGWGGSRSCSRANRLFKKACVQLGNKAACRLRCRD